MLWILWLSVASLNILQRAQLNVAKSVTNHLPSILDHPYVSPIYLAYQFPPISQNVDYYTHLQHSDTCSLHQKALFMILLCEQSLTIYQPPYYLPTFFCIHHTQCKISKSSYGTLSPFKVLSSQVSKKHTKSTATIKDLPLMIF